MSEIVVFTGPSLAHEEVTQRLPNALCLPPVKAGDIIALLLVVKPRVIVIVDGEHLKTPTLSHKEILLALSLGIAVIGCASIGALRAAELVEYGMQGAGFVYQHFLQSPLIDYDELLLTYQQQEEKYTALSLTLMDSRYFLMCLEKARVITQEDRQQLFTAMKAIPYPSRKLAKLHDIIKQHFAGQPELIQKVAQHNFVSVKTLDARETLDALAQGTLPCYDVCVARTNPNINTLYFRSLINRVARSVPVHEALTKPGDQRSLSVIKLVPGLLSKATVLISIVNYLLREGVDSDFNRLCGQWLSENNNTINEYLAQAKVLYQADDFSDNALGEWVCKSEACLNKLIVASYLCLREQHQTVFGDALVSYDKLKQEIQYWCLQDNLEALYNDLFIDGRIGMTDVLALLKASHTDK